MTIWHRHARAMVAGLLLQAALSCLLGARCVADDRDQGSSAVREARKLLREALDAKKDPHFLRLVFEAACAGVDLGAYEAPLIALVSAERQAAVSIRGNEIVAPTGLFAHHLLLVHTQQERLDKAVGLLASAGTERKRGDTDVAEDGAEAQWRASASAMRRRWASWYASKYFREDETSLCPFTRPNRLPVACREIVQDILTMDSPDDRILMIFTCVRSEDSRPYLWFLIESIDSRNSLYVDWPPSCLEPFQGAVALNILSNYVRSRSAESGAKPELVSRSYCFDHEACWDGPRPHMKDSCVNWYLATAYPDRGK